MPMQVLRVIDMLVHANMILPRCLASVQKMFSVLGTCVRELVACLVLIRQHYRAGVREGRG